MNDLMKSSELNQLLLKHSINLNSGIKSDPREDDNVFGGVWVQPEEEMRKNTLSLTGTEIWGPKPQLHSEKSSNSTNSSGKGTSSDVTPEIVPGKRDKFLFGNLSANQDFTNNFSAYSHFTENSFGLTSPSADIPLNQNLSNNIGQRKSDIMGDEKFKSLGYVWNNGNSKAPGSMDALENLAQAMGEWNQQSTLASNSMPMLQKTTDVSSQLPEFCPSFGLQKDLEKNVNCYAPGLPTPPWNTPRIKQQMPGNDNWMKLKGGADFIGNPIANQKAGPNPHSFSSWDQSSKSLFTGLEDAWSNSSSLDMMANKNKLLTNLNNSAAVVKDHPIKFDPSIPPPPLPGLSSLSDLQLLSTLQPEQLLNLLKSNNKAQNMNLTKSNLASSFKSQLGNSVPNYGVQSSSSSIHPWASEQRVNDIKLAVLYRKLARQLFPGHQALNTRSKKLQQLISLGFKREEVGRILMNNDLDFELTLGELIFKTAIAKGLIEDPFKLMPLGVQSLPTQYLDINYLKGMPGPNRHGETFQNYLTSLELLIKQQQQQLLMTQCNARFTSNAQPQIDYTIQALLNNQPNAPLSTFLPNLSFTNNHQPFGNNSRFQQSSIFDSPNSLTPTSPFLSSQPCSVSNLNPQSPEWVPGTNPGDGGGVSMHSETRSASIGSLEVAAILNNLKLTNQTSCPEDVPLTSHSWTSGKVFTPAGLSEPMKSSFPQSNSSSLSGISIKEFIPGVPWNKEAGLSSMSPDSTSQGGGGSNFRSYVSGDRQQMEASHMWMHGLDGNKEGEAFYGQGYGLEPVENEEDGSVAFNGCHSSDEGGYGESLDGSSPSFQSNWVVIKNIPETVSEEDMSDALIVYGPLKSVTFMKETRSVLVCYEVKEDAIEAKNGFDYSEDDDATFGKMSAEFVLDWTMSINESNDDNKPFYGKERQDDAVIENGSDLTEMGYTTPGGLWIPSKVLQDLEFCSTGDEDGSEGSLLADEEDDDDEEEEEEDEEEPSFGCELED